MAGLWAGQDGQCAVRHNPLYDGIPAARPEQLIGQRKVKQAIPGLIKLLPHKRPEVVLSTIVSSAAANEQ